MFQLFVSDSKSSVQDGLLFSRRVGLRGNHGWTVSCSAYKPDLSQNFGVKAQICQIFCICMPEFSPIFCVCRPEIGQKNRLLEARISTTGPARHFAKDGSEVELTFF